MRNKILETKRKNKKLLYFYFLFLLPHILFLIYFPEFWKIFLTTLLISTSSIKISFLKIHLLVNFPRHLNVRIAVVADFFDFSFYIV